MKKREFGTSRPILFEILKKTFLPEKKYPKGNLRLSEEISALSKVDRLWFNTKGFSINLFKIQSRNQNNNIVLWIYIVYTCNSYEKFSVKEREGSKSTFLSHGSYILPVLFQYYP